MSVVDIVLDGKFGHGNRGGTSSGELFEDIVQDAMAYASRPADLGWEKDTYVGLPDGALCADSDEANCKGLDPVDFVEVNNMSDARMAKKVCDRCPIREACLEYARGLGEAGEPVMGVWGGVWFLMDGREKEITPGKLAQSPVPGVRKVRRGAGWEVEIKKGGKVVHSAKHATQDAAEADALRVRVGL